MSEEKKGGLGRIGTILVVVAVLAVLGTCCGCGGVVLWGPQWLMGLFLEDEPMDVPTVDANPGIYREIDERFADGGEVHLTPLELSQLVDPTASVDVEEFHVAAQGEAAELDVSIYVHDAGGRYLNVHLVSEIEVEEGWFTHFQVNELVVSGHDLGQYVAGQELATHVNQSLANQRVRYPEVAAFMDEIEHATIADGQFVVTLQDGGYERIQTIDVQ